MLAFIRRHWVAYLVGLLVAVLVGGGAAYLVGRKISTPDDVRAARLAAEQKDSSLADDLDSSQAGSAQGSAAATDQGSASASAAAAS